MESPRGYGIARLVVAKIVCCGALVLAATGAVSFAGLASWLVGGVYFWLAAAALAVIGLYLWRRSKRMIKNDAGESHVGHPQHGQPE